MTIDPPTDSDDELAAALDDLRAEQAWQERTLRGWSPSNTERLADGPPRLP